MIYRGDHMVYISYIMHLKNFQTKLIPSLLKKYFRWCRLNCNWYFKLYKLKWLLLLKTFNHYLIIWNHESKKTLESFGNFSWESADSDCIRPSGGGHYIENRPGLYSNILKFRYYRLTQDKDLVSNVLSFFHNVLISMFEYSRPANIICFSNLPWNQKPLDA